MSMRKALLRGNTWAQERHGILGSREGRGVGFQNTGAVHGCGERVYSCEEVDGGLPDLCRGGGRGESERRASDEFRQVGKEADGEKQENSGKPMIRDL